MQHHLPKLFPLLALAAGTAAQSVQWVQATPAASPTPRTKPAMAFDGSATVLFGGANLGGFPPQNFADTWIWDGANWTQAQPATAPLGRHFAAMAHDVLRGRTVLYGGISSTLIGGTYRNDTWEWDGATWTQVTTANTPGGFLGNNGVKEHSMAYDLIGQRIVMFGGELFQGIVPAPNLTFEYDGTNWTQTNPTTRPPIRAQASMCGAPTLGGVLLFGGTNFNNPPGPNGEITWNDTWVYSSTNDTWTQIVPSGPVPPPRAGASLLFDGNTGLYVMHGGYASGATASIPLNDTWVFDGATWTDVTASYGAPAPTRVRFSSSEGPAGMHVLFGGAPSFTGQPLAETWLNGPLATANTYGSGCPGGGGIPTLLPTNRPVLGSTFTIHVGGLAANANVGFAMIGLSDTLSPLGVLPVSLAPFGLGAQCQLLHSAEALTLALAAGGTATLNFVMGTRDPALAGYSLYYQYASLDAAAVGGVAMSDGVRAELRLY